jgi:hypothetical protein
VTSSATQPRISTLHYLEEATASTGATLRLMSWTPGGAAPTVVSTLPRDAADNANVSPDGRWLSWVTKNDGALHLADLTGQQTDRVLRRSVDGKLLEPVWSHDSHRLLINDLSAGRDSGVVGTVDVGTGRFTPLPTNLVGARHAVWAADDTAIAFVTADGAVMVAKPDGSAQQRVPVPQRLTAGGRHVVGVQSLSIGGQPEWGRWLTLFIAEPGQGGDARSLISNVYLNAKDGRETSMVGEIGKYIAFQASFRPSSGFGNGAHVLRRMTGQYRIELIGGNGEYWGGGEEPAALDGFLLLSS